MVVKEGRTPSLASENNNNKGDDGKDAASQGTKDGSSHKFTSTPGKAKGKFHLGKGK